MNVLPISNNEQNFKGTMYFKNAVKLTRTPNGEILRNPLEHAFIESNFVSGITPKNIDFDMHINELGLDGIDKENAEMTVVDMANGMISYEVPCKTLLVQFLKDMALDKLTIDKNGGYLGNNYYYISKEGDICNKYYHRGYEDYCDVVVLSKKDMHIDTVGAYPQNAV